MIHHSMGLEGVDCLLGKILFTVFPRKRVKFIVEFLEGRPVKVGCGTSGCKVGGNLKRLSWRKAIDTSFDEWVFADRLVELAVTIVGPVDRFEGHELSRVGREVARVLLISFGVDEAMFELVGATVKFLHNLPRASVRVHEFGNTSAAGVRSDSPSGKNHVASAVNAWVRSLGVPEIAVVGASFFQEDGGDFTRGAE